MLQPLLFATCSQTTPRTEASKAPAPPFTATGSQARITTVPDGASTRSISGSRERINGRVLRSHDLERFSPIDTCRSRALSGVPRQDDVLSGFGLVRPPVSRSGRRPARSPPAECQNLPVDLFHFSHDPAIARFTPHVPATNPDQQPAVWAIDAEHAPLYWFPRRCPRVTAWPRNARERVRFTEAFRTVASRVHAIELDWLPTLGSAVLYRYRFDASAFSP